MCAKSSIEVLLDWISVVDGEGRFINYARWKGGIKTKDAETKSTVASSISTMLKNDHDLVRNQDAVLANLTELSTSHNAARDFLEHTGSGVLERLDAQYEDKTDPAYIAQLDPIHAATLKLCKYYDTLVPIMGGRATARPVVCGSNEDGSITLQDLEGFGDESRHEEARDDSADDEGGGEANVGDDDMLFNEDEPDDALSQPPQTNAEDINNEGSPPRAQSTNKPAKRMKLPVQKAKQPGLIEGLMRSLEGQTAVAERTSNRNLKIKESELAH
ncbi:hypothetical protein ACHHYP_05624 [Achlya hypogyna]|uniref:Uncharacterized protein n=1 Tax=Achlya hypogyna TaxID=1202772 RepID=A0A1V9YXQ5_ACHHY|nr:hypothetical protein ACHHYP_05624 [Achlya hypogyna]